jgi:hypothetical protein
MGSRDSGDSPMNSRDDSSRDSFETISSEQHRSHHSSNSNTPRGSPSPQPNSTNNSSKATPTSLNIGGQNSAFKKIK